MSKKGKHKFPWVPVGIGVGVLALFGLASHSTAATTALEPYEDPALTKTQAAQAMWDKLVAAIQAKGYSLFTAYTAPDGSFAQEFENATHTPGQIPVPISEAFQDFTWKVTAMLKSKTANPDDPATFDALVQSYQKVLGLMDTI